MFVSQVSNISATINIIYLGNTNKGNEDWPPTSSKLNPPGRPRRIDYDIILISGLCYWLAHNASSPLWRETCANYIRLHVTILYGWEKSAIIKLRECCDLPTLSARLLGKWINHVAFSGKKRWPTRKAKFTMCCPALLDVLLSRAAIFSPSPQWREIHLYELLHTILIRFVQRLRFGNNSPTNSTCVHLIQCQSNAIKELEEVSQ